MSFEARDGQYALEMVSLLVARGADLVVEDIYRRTWDRLADDLAPLPGYLNFAEGQDRVASAALAFTPATRERLATLKRSVDPGGVFRHGI
ncbi:MAG: hypothetical protein EOL89_08050 [Actinobacteria bacterium]|nr:hypothetical protein [Actinomycetota bacterium]